MEHWIMVDTHCHLNIMVRNFSQNATFIPLNADELNACQKILDDAKNNNVNLIINVGTNLTESWIGVELTKHFSNCYATLGIHPNDITSQWQQDLATFEKMIKEQMTERKIVGIGECGIDKHYPNFNLKEQQTVFDAQIQLALKHDLPLVIHSRDADEETYQGLANYNGESKLRGTIHCFSSNLEYAEKYINLGFVLGFGGTITYPKNNVLRIVAQKIPLEKIIFETDAPFLPPQTMRGQKNSPSMILFIAEYIAQLRNEDFKIVKRKVEETTNKLFNI